MALNKKSALQEKQGVSQPETTSSSSAKKIKKSRNKQFSVDEFVSKILAGDITFLSTSQTNS